VKRLSFFRLEGYQALHDIHVLLEDYRIFEPNVQVLDRLPLKNKAMKGAASSASLVVVGRGTSIVLVTPDPVPDSGDSRSKDEDNGSVVDSLGCHGDS
jgi:hypothetical protein